MRLLLATIGGALALGASVMAPLLAQPQDSTRSRIGGLPQDADQGRTFRATVNAVPDNAMLARGRLIAVGGAAAGGAGLACVTCHGVNGAGDGAGGIPRIAGLPAWYMYKQLDDYVAGTRINEAMKVIAKALTADEREAVSAYYAMMPQIRVAESGRIDPRQLQWGATLAAIGSAEKGIPACVNCHGAQGEGIAPSVPGLAGQHAAYSVLQLDLWKQGERSNDPLGVMSAIAQKMEAEDMAAVAAYYERITSQTGMPALGLQPTPSAR